jgi:hypothetical protein
MRPKVYPADGPPVKPLEAALYYAEHQRWCTFPAPPGEKKSYVCKAHSKNGRRWGADRDPKILKRHFRWPRDKANIGLPTGFENGIWVLEADTKAGHEVDGIKNLAALVQHYKPLPETLTAISPSGSVHRYFKWPKGLVVRNSASKIAPGVDVRGEGGMVIAPPSIRPGKGAYRWLNWGTPIADAPAWLLKIVASKPRTKRKRADAANYQHANIALIEGALDAITRDCEQRGDWPYGLWFEVGCALHYELGGDGISLFDAWSSASPTYNEADVIKKWEHCSQIDAYKIGTVFHFANEADPRWRVSHEAELWQQTIATMRSKRRA